MSGSYPLLDLPKQGFNGPELDLILLPSNYRGPRKDSSMKIAQLCYLNILQEQACYRFE